MSEKRTSLGEVWVGGGGDGRRPGLLRSKRIHSKTAEKNTFKRKTKKTNQGRGPAGQEFVKRIDESRGGIRSIESSCL